MSIVARGTVQNGAIVTREPLPLPDGTEVAISVGHSDTDHDAEAKARIAEFESLGFHGMWADREDMADSVAWVRKIRTEQWQQRLSRQG